MLILALGGFFTLSGQNFDDLITPFERDANYSASMEETHDWYLKLALQYPELVQTSVAGHSDGGRPLYEVILSENEEFEPDLLRKKGKTMVFILNAIHPGEPCGVDASMLLAREYCTNKKWRSSLRRGVAIVIVPYYNVDGGKDRSPTFRANQQGPVLQGFRGNGLNLDLNRDFIKTDSYNTRTFVRLFHKWDPDVFVDTHTTNGADFQHAITLIATQPDNLPTPLARMQQGVLLPALYQGMNREGWPMCPYIAISGPPERGFYGFMDSPRYSSGYAALFHSLSFISEAHMLKPFSERVEATRVLLTLLTELASEHGEEILAARRKARIADRLRTTWPIQWERDTTRSSKVIFSGYEATRQPGAVTGVPRWQYDRSKPFTKEVDFYPHFKPVTMVSTPVAYVIPQAWKPVIERILWRNPIHYEVQEDTWAEAEVMRIVPSERTPTAYEGRYPHRSVQVTMEKDSVWLRAGDLVLPTDQDAVSFLVRTLEPHATDSWFVWNFFDAILDQKEYFSAYLFEDIAAALLESDGDLKRRFEEAKHNNPDWEAHPEMALDWIYKHSPYYEPTHLRYPVVRLQQFPATWYR